MPRQAEPGINVQTLHATDGVTIGRFTCRLSDPLWDVENYIGDQHHVVFPSTAVEIHQAGTKPLLADPNQLVLYDPGTIYTRRPVSRAGDVCTFLMVTPASLVEAAAAVGLPLGEGLCFPSHCAPSESRTYLLARLLAKHLRLVDTVDPLLAEEGLATLVERSLSDAASFFEYRVSVTDRLRSHHRDVVEAVHEIVNERVTEKLSLIDIAGRVSWSPYHLARVFRLHMRSSIYSYRQSLRLRYCLERALQGRARMYEIATEAGFSSPAHLTAAFRRAFGMPPSAVRRMPDLATALARLSEIPS